MKKSVLIILAFITTVSLAQNTDTAQKEAMKKLSWYIGQWHGTSTTNLGGGKKSVVDITETVRYELDSMLVVVTTKGFEQDTVTNAQKTVNNDFIIISFNPKDNTYTWSAWKNPGGSTTAYEIKPSDNKFESGSKVQAGQTRFTTSLNEQGQLVETGEFSRDGEKWVTFKSAALDKVK